MLYTKYFYIILILFFPLFRFGQRMMKYLIIILSPYLPQLQDERIDGVAVTAQNNIVITKAFIFFSSLNYFFS